MADIVNYPSDSFDRAECGCYLARSTKGPGIVSFSYCPLHAAAADMLAMLEGVEDGILGSLESAAAALGDGSLLALVRANRAAVLGIIGRARGEKVEA